MMIRKGLGLLSGLAVAVSAHAAQPPAAYFIAEFSIHDRAAMQPYRARVESTFQPFGGHFVARGGTATSLEGQGMQGNIVIIRFDSLAQAQAWYASPAYAPLKAIRHAAATTRAYIVTTGPDISGE